MAKFISCSASVVRREEDGEETAVYLATDDQGVIWVASVPSDATGWDCVIGWRALPSHPLAEHNMIQRVLDGANTWEKVVEEFEQGDDNARIVEQLRAHVRNHRKRYPLT